MRFKWYSLDKESHSRELKVKQQRAKGCEARSNSLADNISVIRALPTSWKIIFKLLIKAILINFASFITFLKTVVGYENKLSTDKFSYIVLILINSYKFF